MDVTSRSRCATDAAERAFLGHSDTAKLIARRDWSATSIGSIDQWPQSLKSVLSIMMHGTVPMVLLWNEDGVMLYNDAYSRFAGGRHPELLGTKVREGWPEVADFNDNVMRVGLAGGTLSYKDHELTLLRHGHPEQVFMDLSYSPVLDESGEPGGVLCVLTETTERVQSQRQTEAAEAALREETSALATLNRTGAALAAELDLERVVQMVTDAGVELTGAKFGAFFHNVAGQDGESYMLYTLSGADISAFESLGMPRATPVFKPTFDGTGVIRSNDILADLRYGKLAPHHGMPDGHLPVRSYLAVPVTSREGDVIGGLFFGHPEPGRFGARHEQLMLGAASQAAIAIDNARLYQSDQRTKETLERRVQEALAQRNLLADVVESTDAIVQIVAPDFTFLGINRAAADEYERMFGFRPKAGDNKLELCRDHPAYWTMAQRLWARALSGEEFAEVTHLVDREGNQRSYEMRFNVLRDSEGQQIGAYQFAHDITERLDDHRRLAEAQDALRQSQKMEAVGQLVSGLAHDFNNVLGAVIGALDLIGRRPDESERVRRFAEAGLQAAERGSKLTSQLLAFSRSQRIELKPIFVCDVIENLREMLSRTLGPMIGLEFALNPDPVPVLADATQVEMMVLNLALNARDAMPDGGRLSISTKARTISGDAELADGKYVELTVADTGTGMDPQTLARAMDPFFTTKALGKGTGLGLAQVYGSARQAGGTVRIESVLDEGTAVRVLLPRTELSCESSEGDGTATLPTGSGGGRILVVDDDIDMRGMIVNSLETLGFSVLEAADGPSGLTVLETTRPDALVVDFAMPGMTGAEFAAAARERYPHIPIVIASGYADSASIERAVGTSAQLLRKPFRVDELLNAVSHAIRSD
ncbi:PAS domain-containing protein [Altererythrobacter sp. Root672]|uniref:GAF domain-containing hybrid sensor histidine kinase/response regulator n=1 Tax=Altererythrobacter sp. Root672 TaxID=1736584 RepID=UPI0006F63A54|nr:PAS domain-containing protein [Altererythrobacter sp. Root672]KRA80757.1 hypothetical protein ASD76_16625 [Altererythrobacter sp. Root672]